MKLKCLVIDDEPIAREGITGYVKQIGFLELVGVAEDSSGGAEFLKQHTVDLLLLDIQMPELNGIEFLKTCINKPLTILITAYPQFALEGYDLDITDYLLKPVPFERFLKAANKALEIYQLRNTSRPAFDYIFVKCEQRYEKIHLDRIQYIEGLENYLIIYTSARKYTCYLTMKQMENSLPPSSFLRVHRSFIVALEAIEAVEGNTLILKDRKIPLSREKRESLFSRIINRNLLKR